MGLRRGVSRGRSQGGFGEKKKEIKMRMERVERGSIRDVLCVCMRVFDVNCVGTGQSTDSVMRISECV